MGNNVKFLGKVDNPETYLQQSNFYVHGADEEPFGLVLIEAMASGLPVFTTEEGIKTISNFFGKLFDWKKLDDLIPKNFKNDIKFRKTGKAGIFAGSLELVKDGKLKIKQKNLFEDIYIKETK